MQLFKFKVILIYICSLVSNDIYALSLEGECLTSTFDLTVSHKGKPFGLSKNILNINKNKCLIEIHHQKLFYIKHEWKIDICRSPIHIKEVSGTVEVYKKTLKCHQGDNSENEFCDNVYMIQDLIQDDGLIFADGEKEDLLSDHGRVYCVSKLVDEYFHANNVMSIKAMDYLDFFKLKHPAKKLIKNNIVPLAESKAIPVLEQVEDNIPDEESSLQDFAEKMSPSIIAEPVESSERASF